MGADLLRERFFLPLVGEVAARASETEYRGGYGRQGCKRKYLRAFASTPKERECGAARDCEARRCRSKRAMRVTLSIVNLNLIPVPRQECN